MSDAALSAGTVQTRTADGIATVEFAHPKGNSLPSALLVELAAEGRELTRMGGGRSVEALRSDAALFIHGLCKMRRSLRLCAGDGLGGTALLGGKLACGVLPRLLELGGHSLGLEVRLEQLSVELRDAAAQLVGCLGEGGVRIL